MLISDRLSVLRRRDLLHLLHNEGCFDTLEGCKLVQYGLILPSRLRGRIARLSLQSSHSLQSVIAY